MSFCPFCLLSGLEKYIHQFGIWTVRAALESVVGDIKWKLGDGVKNKHSVSLEPLKTAFQWHQEENNQVSVWS